MMPITKKPTIDDQKADAFIGAAKADNVQPQRRDTVNPLTRNTVEAVSRESGKTLTRDTAKPLKRKTVKTGKKTKMTFYMTPEMYVKWKGYELQQIQSGKKVTFQGVIEAYMNKLLR